MCDNDVKHGVPLSWEKASKVEVKQEIRTLASNVLMLETIYVEMINTYNATTAILYRLTGEAPPEQKPAEVTPDAMFPRMTTLLNLIVAKHEDINSKLSEIANSIS